LAPLSSAGGEPISGTGSRGSRHAAADAARPADRLYYGTESAAPGPPIALTVRDPFERKLPRAKSRRPRRRPHSDAIVRRRASLLSRQRLPAPLPRQSFVHANVVNLPLPDPHRISTSTSADPASQASFPAGRWKLLCRSRPTAPAAGNRRGSTSGAATGGARISAATPVPLDRLLV